MTSRKGLVVSTSCELLLLPEVIGRICDDWTRHHRLDRVYKCKWFSAFGFPFLFNSGVSRDMVESTATAAAVAGSPLKRCGRLVSAWKLKEGETRRDETRQDARRSRPFSNKKKTQKKCWVRCSRQRKEFLGVCNVGYEHKETCERGRELIGATHHNDSVGRRRGAVHHPSSDRPSRVA